MICVYVSKNYGVSDKWRTAPIGTAILQGARQVGKHTPFSNSAEHYENVAYFNFETDPSLLTPLMKVLTEYLIPICPAYQGKLLFVKNTLYLMKCSFGTCADFT